MSTHAEANTAESTSPVAPASSAEELVVSTESSNVKIRYPTDIPCGDFITKLRVRDFFDASESGVLQTKDTTITIVPELRAHIDQQLGRTFNYWRHLSQRRRDQVCNSEALWAIIKRLYDDIEVNHAIVFTTLAGVGIANSGVERTILKKRRAIADVQEILIKQTKAPVDVLAQGEPITFVPAFLYNPGRILLQGPTLSSPQPTTPSQSPATQTTAPSTTTPSGTPTFLAPRSVPPATGWLTAPARKAPTLSLRESAPASIKVEPLESAEDTQ